jgi:hypothetical protein
MTFSGAFLVGLAIFSQITQADLVCVFQIINLSNAATGTCVGFGEDCDLAHEYIGSSLCSTSLAVDNVVVVTCPAAKDSIALFTALADDGLVCQ